MSRIYVASSWRNTFQPGVVAFLRLAGHEVYDFRNPVEGDAGFSWKECDPDWEKWTPAQYREALKSEPAVRGFGLDMAALKWCDTCLLVQPCGRSAHLELGWCIGTNRVTALYFPQGVTVEPELMPAAAGAILITDLELGLWAARLPGGGAR